MPSNARRGLAEMGEIVRFNMGATSSPEPEAVCIRCDDGLHIAGHYWKSATTRADALAIIAAATGVRAHYYHRYARFLARHGFDVVTFDYRGIGASRPDRLRGCSYRWSDWGTLDFEAVIKFAIGRASHLPLVVIGHSIGGFLPGLAGSASCISRMLTIGAQHAWWRDYAPERRLTLFIKWHIVMPLLTGVCGYFPGSVLGWIEDLPAGVANEWSFRRSRYELGAPPEAREAIIEGFAKVCAPVLAVCIADDDLAPRVAIERGLSHYPSARSEIATVSPEELGVEGIGHAGIFHSRFETSFWLDSLLWLRDGINPWAGGLAGKKA